MSNLEDEVAALNEATSKMLKQVDALQRSIQGQVEYAALQTKVTLLLTQIEIDQREIKTRTALAQAIGKKPEISDLVRSLKEHERELEEIKAKYGLPSADIPHKRWWEFWK